MRQGPLCCMGWYGHMPQMRTWQVSGQEIISHLPQVPAREVDQRRARRVAVQSHPHTRSYTSTHDGTDHGSNQRANNRAHSGANTGAHSGTYAAGGCGVVVEHVGTMLYELWGWHAKAQAQRHNQCR